MNKKNKLEKILAKLSVGEKVQLSKLLKHEFLNMVIYSTQTTAPQSDGYTWLTENRKGKKVQCSNCKEENLIEYFDNTTDYPREIVIKNPKRVLCICRNCGKKLNKIWWYTCRYPYSTSTFPYLSSPPPAYRLENTC